jgi:circadian clock protein KaiC
MRSIGLALGDCLRKGYLRFHAARPTFQGLEAHLTAIYGAVRDFEPRLVVVDPITNLSSSGSAVAAEAMLMRLVDFFKSRQITTVLTALTSGGGALEATDVGISSLVDTWILLRDIESGGERNRGICVLKSRGMAHSNQIREFHLTPHGIRLTAVYRGPEGALTGSARVAQYEREKASATAQRREAARRDREHERRRAELEADIAAKRRTFEAELDDEKEFAQGDARVGRFAPERRKRGSSRGSTATARAGASAPGTGSSLKLAKKGKRP